MDDPRRQLDFWLGCWRCDWEGGTGRNTVEAVCDGRVIRESFQADGLIGTSISVYDETAGSWVQTWMDSQGGWFHLTGAMRDGAFELETTTPDAEGRRKRMRFAAITHGSFEWTWARSVAGGGWEQLWRIAYSRTR